MILKSKTWKTKGKKHSPQFKRLFSYLEHEQDESFDIYHNFRSKNDRSRAIKEMYHQHSFKRRRANGISHFHEILSISKKDESHVTLDMLHTLSQEYIRLRCPNALCYAKAHTHGKNKHVHFVISSNELGSDKALRLSKAQYQDIKVSLEKFQIERFPELENSIVHSGSSRENSRTKNDDVEKQTKKRTKKALEKEKVSGLVSKAVSRSKSIDDLSNSLDSMGAEIYFYREKPSGVVYEDKKYRWKTLLIEKDRIEQLIATQKEKDLRMEQLNDIQKERNNSLNKGIER